MQSRFSKAAPKQARLKLALYGPPGSGKTFSTLLMAEGLARVRGGRIAYVDTERGTDFYAQASKGRAVHPGAFDFDALYTRSLAEVSEAVRSLPIADYSVVVIDSITHLWEAAIEAYDGKRTSRGDIPIWAWGQIKKPYKALIKGMIASPLDVFILGRQKNLFEEAADDRIRKVGVAMKAEGETAYEPHICLRMEAKQDEHNPLLTRYLCYAEKDRTGVLAGRTYENPTYAMIEPLLPLLGEEQAAEEDEDERIAKDGELLDIDEDKSKAKTAKSAKLYAEHQAALTGAASLAELGIIGDSLKKNKRYLLDEHLQALRVLYGHRRDGLVQAEAAEM